jgi:hypothetical protein
MAWRADDHDTTTEHHRDQQEYRDLFHGIFRHYHRPIVTIEAGALPTSAERCAVIVAFDVHPVGVLAEWQVPYKASSSIAARLALASCAAGWTAH